jgi:hypothetical protein
MSTQPNAPPRCFWCHGAEGELIGLGRSWAGSAAPLHAHPGHRASAVKFITRAERLRRAFLGLFLAVIVLAPIVAVLRTAYTEAAGIALGAFLAVVGTWLIAMPFATPQTVRWLGARSASRLVRVLGVLIIGAGALSVLT